jgi:hypothetical protein
MLHHLPRVASMSITTSTALSLLGSCAGSAMLITITDLNAVESSCHARHQGRHIMPDIDRVGEQRGLARRQHPSGRCAAILDPHRAITVPLCVKKRLSRGVWWA